MIAPQNFRSAFNGFNREDVVNHISYMSTKHESVTNQLRAEAEALRQELAELQRNASIADAGRIEELEQALEDRDQELSDRDSEMAALRQELDEANQLLSHRDELLAAREKEMTTQEKEMKALRKELADLRDRLAEAKEEAAKPAAIEKSANHWDELRAYRRAETAERRARERVNELYDGASAALRTAGEGLGTTTAAIDVLVEQFRADLVALQEAIDAGRDSLTAAAKTLEDIRPLDEESA